MKNSQSTAREVHLVLGSGGVKCISYAGALCELEERGIVFKTVSACSAGTLIGSLLCIGMSAAEIQRAVDRDLSKLKGEPVLPRPLHLFGLLKWPFALYKEPGYLNLFRELLQQRDPVLSDLQIPLSVMGVDISAGRILLYSSDTHPDMPVSEAIRIATSIPMAYPPYEFSPGNIVVDAVFVTQAPVWIPLSYKDNLPVVVIQAGTPARRTRHGNILAILMDCFTSGVISRDYYTQQLPRVRTIAIDTGNVRFNNFKINAQARNKLIEAGREKARELLNQWGDDLWSIETPPLILDRERTTYSTAVDNAAEVITGYQRKLPKLARERVFISYAHEDVEWMKRLKEHLGKHPGGSSLMIWDDTEIKAGEHWRNKIRTALASTRVAVLLVSSHFLESEYITKVELDYLLWALKYEDVKLIWFTLDTCEYRKFGRYDTQAAFDPDKPLAGLEEAEQEKALDDICGQIAEKFEEYPVAPSSRRGDEP